MDIIRHAKWCGSAVDLGASGGRVVVGRFDGDKLSIEEMHRFENIPVQVFDTIYWDILRIFNDIKIGLRKTKNKLSEEKTCLSSIGIDSWGVDFALLDKEGRLCGNPVHYRDKRTSGIDQKVFELISKEEIFNITGIQFLPFNSIFQLAAMKMNNEASLLNAKTMLMIPDLIRYFLTGDISSEYTDATTTQLYDSVNMCWSEKIINKLGLPISLFPRIIHPASVVGKIFSSTSEELGGLNADVIAVATHDTASAVASVPSLKKQFAYISCGTWSCLGTESDKPVINDKALALNFTNEGGIANTFRILKNLMGLWLLQETRREWERKGRYVHWEDITKMAQNGKPLSYFINPNDYFFLAPGDMPARVRDYCKNTNQSIPEKDEDLLRCIIEGLAFEYRYELENLEKLQEKKFDELHIIGGGVQNRLLCQWTSNAINRPIIAGPVEATAKGNIIVQMMAERKIKNISQARELIRKSFPPHE